MDAVINFYGKHWNLVKSFFDNPQAWFKNYIDDLKQKSVGGKIRKVLGTVGEWILLYFMLALGIFVLLIVGLVMFCGGSSPRKATYYQMLQQQEKEEYEERTGKPW